MASSDENSEHAPSADLISVQNPVATRLLGQFQSFGGPELIIIALIYSGIPFALSLVIAVFGGFGLEFLSTGSVYVWTAGLFGGALTFGWWAKRYPEVWMKLRSSFDVSDDEYWLVVRPRIETMYDLRRARLWFLGFSVLPVVAVVVFVLGTGIPTLISLSSPPDYWVWAINYTFGLASLLGLVIAFNVVFTHFRLVGDIMKLPLQDRQLAAAELKPLARFNIVASAGWFASLTVGIRLLEIDIDSLASLLTATSAGESLINIGFLVMMLIGFILFLVPQYSIHAGILSSKLELLDEIDAEYDKLYEEISSADGATNSLDQMSVQLDVLDARRRSAKEIQTWAYDLPGILSLIAASVVPIVGLFV